MIKSFRFVVIASTLLLACISGFAQMRSGGEVVDVINGKTVVVAIPSGRLTIELQYIDVPEPAQALHAAINDHVRRLLIGKAVELETRGFARDRATARLILNGVDVSQQLLRDGAAWHIPIEVSGQSESEFETYAGFEALARQEKRGVWSITGLKPAWEIRAENEERRRAAEVAARGNKPTPVGVNQYRTDTRRGGIVPEASKRSQMDSWVSTLAFAREEGYGLHVYKDPNGRLEAIYTSPLIIEFSSSTGRERLECRAMYVSTTRYDGSPLKLYLIAFRAISDDYRFSRTVTRLTGSVDGKPIGFGGLLAGYRGQGLIGAGSVATGELMFFGTSRATLQRIGRSRSAELRINKFRGTISNEARDLFKQLGDAGD